MIFSLVLMGHIVVALTTIALFAVSAYALAQGKSSLYKKLAVAIGALAAFETISGFMLAALSPTISVAYVASHLVAYLGICLVVEAALMLRMRSVWIG